MTARWIVGLALVGLVAPAARADIVEPLAVGGPIANRLNVAILGDGYTASPADQAKLGNDARAVLTGLLSFGPYQTYHGLFNVKLIYTVSASSTVPKNGHSGQTALGCYFGCAGIDRLVCCESGSEGSVAAVIAANVPEATLSIVVVNDPTYGGSGGSSAVVSVNDAAIDILRHEFGHTLAGLADEYTAPFPGYPGCDPVTDCSEPNATLFAQRPGKWGQWVNADVCVPTMEGKPGVGYFEGCRYRTSGVFRPVSNPRCLMNALGYAFCPVCEEAVSLALWSRARAVDSATPPTTAAVQTTGCTLQSFAIVTAANAGLLAIAWFIDGVPQSNATTATASFDTNLVAPGTHQVVATVRDTNPAIRVDPNQLTTTSTTWTWQTSCPSGMAPDAGIPPDAALPDAAPSDASGACQVNEAIDGGDVDDMPPAAGCCSARSDGPAGALIAAIVVMVPLLRRRRRGSSAPA